MMPGPGAALLLVLAAAVVVALALWYRRRGLRQARLIEAANSRLRLPIPEFALSDRKVIIHRLLADAELQADIRRSATAQGIAVSEATARARQYAEEIGPAFNVFFYFKLGYWLARGLLRLHYRIAVVSHNDETISSLRPDATVILVSNHRSNLDPLLITYLASRRSTVALSAGEWARLWPLHHLVRAAGGFVVDRNATDPLYRRVLGAYLRVAAAAGLHQAFFPEGELTRDGKMAPPKLGFLNYYCRSLNTDRDIVFIPVGVNYDRIPEDRRLARAQSGFENPSSRFLIGSSLRYALSLLPLIFSRRSNRYGYASAAFGEPLSLTAWLAARDIDPRTLTTGDRLDWLPTLASELMGHCAREIPVMPTVLVATVMCAAPQQSEWQLTDLRQTAGQLLQQLTVAGANLFIPGGLESALDNALQILRSNGLVQACGSDRYTVIESERPVLRHYANSIAHLVGP